MNLLENNGKMEKRVPHGTNGTMTHGLYDASVETFMVPCGRIACFELESQWQMNWRNLIMTHGICCINGPMEGLHVMTPLARCGSCYQKFKEAT